MGASGQGLLRAVLASTFFCRSDYLRSKHHEASRFLTSQADGQKLAIRLHVKPNTKSFKVEWPIWDREGSHQSVSETRKSGKRIARVFSLQGFHIEKQQICKEVNSSHIPSMTVLPGGSAAIPTLIDFNATGTICAAAVCSAMAAVLATSLAIQFGPKR